LLIIKNNFMETKIRSLIVIVFIATGVIIYGCTETDSTKGVGPIKNISIDSNINTSLSAQGKQIFDLKCAICHTFDKRSVGPLLKGVTQKRKPEWIMNMILNPAEMTSKDVVAKELLKEYKTPMVFQDIKEDEARSILEYLREKDKE